MKQPSIYIPHGGGPCFFMDPPEDDPERWVALAAYLRSLPSLLPAKPDAIVVISGHWEEPRPTVQTSAKPPLLFDYYNFPPHTYQLTYPAPGAPALAARVRGLLEEAGIESGEDRERGFDHGVFIPLKVSFPDAEVPIIELSMQNGLDPARHIAIGKALASLRDDNILILGSGLSFHNLRRHRRPESQPGAEVFDRWLTDILCDGPVESREARLAQWSLAPGARICQPREDHLLPLMVAAGAGTGEIGRHAFSGKIWGKAVSAFHFG